MSAPGTTPGPWVVEADMRTDQHWYGNGDGPEYLAGWNINATNGEIVGIEGICPSDQAEANAYLIAAAQDLYDAAQEAADLCVGTFAEGGSAHKRILAALAKARGEA